MSQAEKSTIEPFSLRDAPALIERLFPAQKISAEAQNERGAHAAQWITALGSYWKGRKPLILVRACVLGALLPALDDDPEADLAIFEKLMAIDDNAFRFRLKRKSAWPAALHLPYIERVRESLRPEELGQSYLDDAWIEVNTRYGTNAHSLPELVEQLGIMRYGHAPRVADTFSGGGSIPFEAARIGCDVFASDLNPIACMLTWGALNLIGATPELQERIALARKGVAETVDLAIQQLGVEQDASGNRAKAYLYCLEARCPKTGWLVPLAPSWLISKIRGTIAKLKPNRDTRTFSIEIVSGVSEDEMKAAANLGTVRDGNLIYELDGETYSTPMKTLRGDVRTPGGESTNRLRRWTKSDFRPSEDDVFQERLYCIQWMTASTVHRARPETYFASVTNDDLRREAEVVAIVGKHLTTWQANGYVPEMAIEPGDKTDELIRTRGWTYWHHLFNPRQLLIGAMVAEAIASINEPILQACLSFDRTFIADKSARLSHWRLGSPAKDGRAPSADGVENVFYNQALNTLYTYAARGFLMLTPGENVKYRTATLRHHGEVRTQQAREIQNIHDMFITDPPYADAVMYHEITEFFIAWLRLSPPAPFAEWVWDSRRALAIRGEGDLFRQRMVEAYSCMTRHMPDNGIQIVMFTHQSGEVWADMAQIFWGAGLQVMAAWYIATETSSDLKKGGYVQGTVILVLRKRRSDESGYRDEIVQEVKAEVARQIDTMVGLNQSLKGRGRIENLFEDADLQMAGYAAALRVLTGYARIDGTDMTREALRPRKKGERTLVSDIIDFSVQVANEHLVPEGLDARVWDRLTGSERFYLKMMDIETTGATKLDNYQNFAKAFRVPDYTVMMGSLKPNAARLRSAAVFKKADFVGSEFATSPTRALLYALYELQQDVDGDLVLKHLRDQAEGYMARREDLAEIAAYIARKRADVDGAEASAARVVLSLIRNERLGG